MKEISIKEVNRIFKCNVLEPGRKQTNVNGRIAIANHIRSTKRLKIAEIGKILNKDHATISHYLRIHEYYYKYDVNYRIRYDALSKPKVYHREFCCYTMLEFNRITASF